ncbi:MAG TPA: VPLPA-CTERM sorting domain-containing protein [Paracoccaceae bacterium]|nr:VPLPA-CTERM sorting domain-containing protein [Paracoccaceae bacterium]
MFRHALLAASSAAMLVFAGPANALAAFDGFSFSEFGWEFDRPGVTVSTDFGILDANFSESGAGLVTEWAPDQFETTASAVTSGSVAGQVSAPFGAASAFLLTDVLVSFVNEGPDLVTLSYSWRIGGVAQVLVEDPATEIAEVGAFATVFGEFFDASGARSVVIDAEGFAFANDFFPDDLFDDFVADDIVLEPGASFDVFMTADQDGFAEVAVGAVPLPAAAPLLLAGLAAFGAAAARRRR